MSSRSSSKQRRPLEILVLDDSDHSRHLIALAIESNMGIPPLLASSGKEALALMEEHSVDVVVCDLFMPELDGFQFLLRARDLFPAAKVVLVSSDFGAFWVTPRRMIAEGALAVIPKFEVASTLIDILRKSEANR
jgi:CheY-like chemotaxis protein